MYDELTLTKYGQSRGGASTLGIMGIPSLHLLHECMVVALLIVYIWWMLWFMHGYDFAIMVCTDFPVIPVWQKLFS